ncbi:MAG TPA: substrate-binding domain-containing protein [Magnetospirillum sp.]|nr:substrate-binding domain-containing protein [Magnetospirillum sp.]
MAHFLLRLALAVVCLLAGEGALARNAAGEEIGVIVHGHTHGFFRGLERGMRKAADDLGVRLLVRSLSERAIMDNPDNLHLRIIDYMLSQKVAGIVMAPETLKGVDTPVSLPVPLVLVDRDGPQYDARSTVSTDNFAAGRAAALSLASVLAKGANVMVLRLRPDVPSTLQREEGFISVAVEKGWNVVGDPFVGNRFRETEEYIARLLQGHGGKLDAVFAPNESVAFGAVRVVGAMAPQSRPRLATIDWRPEFRQALEDGTLSASVLQDNESMGYRAVAVAVAASRGKDVPVRVSVDFAVITRANMNEPALQRMSVNYELP